MSRHPILHYDVHRHRLWIGGQRCHHGATGALLTAVAAGGLLAARLRTLRWAGVAAAGSLLMAHDWKDRGRWFARGWQE